MKKIGIIFLLILLLPSFSQAAPQASNRTRFFDFIRNSIPNPIIRQQLPISRPPINPSRLSSRTPQNSRLSPQTTFTNLCEGRNQSQCQSESLCSWRSTCLPRGSRADCESRRDEPQCKNEQLCSWDENINTCFPAGTTVDVVYGANICSRLNEPIKCNANRLCFWNPDEKECWVNPVIVNFVPEDTVCAPIDKEDACNTKSGCVWRPKHKVCAMMNINSPSFDHLTDPGFPIPTSCDKRERMLACVSDQKCKWSVNSTQSGYCRAPGQTLQVSPENNICGVNNQKIPCEAPQTRDICKWARNGASNECLPKIIGDGESSLAILCYGRDYDTCKAPIQISCEWQSYIDNICISNRPGLNSGCTQIESSSLCKGVFSDTEAGGKACKWIQNGSCINQ